MKPTTEQITRYLLTRWTYRGNHRWQTNSGKDRRGIAVTIDTSHMSPGQTVRVIASVEDRPVSDVLADVAEYDAGPLTIIERAQMRQEAA